MDATLSPLDVAGIDAVTGEVPKHRVADVNTARTIHKALWQSDLGSSKNRSLIDAMFNGAPPLLESDLKESGQQDRVNYDSGVALAIKEQALAQYYDLTSSVPCLLRVKLKNNYATLEQRNDWEAVISEEAHRTLTEWGDFEFNHQLLSDQFVSHGVGIAYFEDDTDWRYRVCGLNDFKIPRGTKATESEVEVATIEREYMAHQLYAFIKDPEVAKEAGWNVEMVKQALMHACVATQTPYMADWEKLERDLKNNDLLYGNSRSKKINVIHMLVQEFGGQVSHQMFLKDPLPSDATFQTEKGKASEDFLYKKFGKFKNPNQAFVAFTYGVGNGCYHSIRGLGFKIYPHIQVINRIRCGMADGALLSSSLVVQPSGASDRSLEDLTLSFFGPYALFPPGLKIVEKAVPDFRQTALPVLADLTQTVQNNTGGYQSRAANADGQSRTAFEVRAQLQQESILSSASINLFYHPWKRLLGEVVRRLTAPGASVLLPGGREAVDFKTRCMARGVPEAAFVHIEQVDPVKAIGNGSSQMRTVALQQLMSLFGTLDQEGQNHLLRDVAASLVGQEAVDRYIRPPSVPLRPPIDDKIAILENAEMSHGTTIPVSFGEDDFAHAQRHLQAMDELDQGLIQGQMDPQAAFTAFQSFLPHTAQHVQRLGQDKLRAQQVGLMRQRLQQLQASAKRLGDELQARQINAQKAQQAQAQRQQTEQAAQLRLLQEKAARADALDPELRQKLVASQAKMQMEAEEHRQKLAQEAAEHQQKLALRDAESAAKIETATRAQVPSTVPMAMPDNP